MHMDLWVSEASSDGQAFIWQDDNGVNIPIDGTKLYRSVW